MLKPEAENLLQILFGSDSEIKAEECDHNFVAYLKNMPKVLKELREVVDTLERKIDIADSHFEWAKKAKSIEELEAVEKSLCQLFEGPGIVSFVYVELFRNASREECLVEMNGESYAIKHDEVVVEKAMGRVNEAPFLLGVTQIIKAMREAGGTPPMG